MSYWCCIVAHHLSLTLFTWAVSPPCISLPSCIFSVVPSPLRLRLCCSLGLTPSPLPCVGLICGRAQGSIRASLSLGRLPGVFYLVSEHTLIPCYVSETLFKIYLIFIRAPCSRPYHHSYCPDKEGTKRESYLHLRLSDGWGFESGSLRRAEPLSQPLVKL